MDWTRWTLVACAVAGAVLGAVGPVTPGWVRPLLFAILALVLVWSSYSSYRPSYQYLRTRPVERATWSRVFPADQMPLVLEVLGSVRDAFLLRNEDIDRLRPTDRLLDIYRAAYPTTWEPDALEFETLWRELRDRFHVPESELRTLTGFAVKDVIEVCLVHHRGLSS